jgi:hypothetical protein
MAEEPENLVLELLRGIRSDLGRIEGRLVNVETKVDGLTTRLDELAAATSGILQILGLMSGRADRTDQAVERIEKRLDRIEKHIQLEKV